MSVIPLNILGLDALNRNERNYLRSQHISPARGERSNQFDIDMFDVPSEKCTGKDWGEQIDSWDIVSHELGEADCGKYYEGFRCLCRAYFSLGSIIGVPQYICEPCVIDYYDYNGYDNDYIDY